MFKSFKMRNKSKGEEQRIKYPFDLRRTPITCPHCSKKKEWTEVICKKCGYSEFSERFIKDI